MTVPAFPIRILRAFLTIMLLAAGTAAAQDYSFDIPEEEEPRLIFSGNLDVKWALLHARERSPFYRMQFQQYDDPEKNLSQYRLDYYFNSEYRNDKLFFEAKTFTQYAKNEPLDVSLYELYGSVNLSPRLSAGAGKKRVIWGKGYAFNPVGYVNTEKDPENPDLALAGKPMLYANYNRSYSSEWMRNVSFSGMILPPEAEYADRFADAGDTEYAAKAYFLVKDVDVDILLFSGKNELKKYGLDFSTNILSNLEVHGEWSFADGDTRYLVSGTNVVPDGIDAVSYLVGLRYLNTHNTTFILEYYNNGGGLNRAQYRDYIGFLNASLSDGGEEAIAGARNASGLVSRSKTLMKEYLYLNVKQAEPFSLVYSSVSVFSIYNIADESILVSPRFSYAPYTNFELLLWPSMTFGKKSSEFGNKLFDRKIEVWLRYYF